MTATSKPAHTPPAALYLLLVTAGDAMGLSYYSDASIIKRLSMDPATLCQRECDNVPKKGMKSVPPLKAKSW